MECVETSFLYSLLWSAGLVSLIAKIRCESSFKPFLTELYSPPIVLSIVLSIAVTWFLYEPLPEPEVHTLATMLSKPANIMSSWQCNFISVFNVLGYILPVVTVLSFIHKNNPYFFSSLRTKVLNWFD
ncbi:hypothetical protein DET53_1162 [Vibrio parahaemolyticus]|jgi:hypothetical protein|nr:hypothetical protein DET53_1162 [Vibrio parahaemolyticus]